MSDHRLYDIEVLDFSKNVSFILLIPPRDLVCSIKSQPTIKSGTQKHSSFRSIFPNTKYLVAI